MLLLSLILTASGLDDARAALAKLDAKPVRGEMKVMRWQRAAGKETSAGVTFFVSDGPKGVALQAAPGMLHEKAAGIVSTTTLMRVHHLLDARAELLHQLERAELISEENVTWKERPARLLKLKVEAEELKKVPSQVSVSLSGSVANLWIDASGLPLAGELGGDVEAGVLMIKVKTHSKVTREYGLVGGRLVVTRESDENDANGAGQQLQVRQSTELKLEAVE